MIDIYARHAALTATVLTPREASQAMIETEVREFARAFGLTRKESTAMAREFAQRFPLPERRA